MRVAKISPMEANWTAETNDSEPSDSLFNIFQHANEALPAVFRLQTLDLIPAGTARRRELLTDINVLPRLLQF